MNKFQVHCVLPCCTSHAACCMLLLVACSRHHHIAALPHPAWQAAHTAAAPSPAAPRSWGQS